jgi:acetoacetyl-CoA reductase
MHNAATHHYEIKSSKITSGVIMSKRIALVTGGTGGIGTAICRELTNKNCSVIATYFPPEKQPAEAWQKTQQQKGFEITISPVDVSDYDSAKNLVTHVEQVHGSIDILVNCAGITRDKTLQRMTPDQWNAVIRTNLDSAFNITQPVVTGMIERGYGRIINIASVNGQKGQFGQSNYSAAKAGLHGFTMAVAQETASKGITVNTISPGYVSTSMTRSMPREVLDQIVSQVPVGRMATPEEIAFTVGWLADERNGYTTGANIPVNGGMFMSA